MIELDRDGSVWVLRMRAGENRFSPDWLDAVNAALDQVEAADGPRALVTAGDGKFYSNGLDLDWLAGAGERAGENLTSVYRLLGRVLAFPALTVAAVNGHAFGGGALLATAHDFAVMREDRGYWCMPEADLGLPLSPELLSVLTAKLPARSVQEAVLTGRRYGGPAALAAGIVHQVAGEEQVLPAAVKLAAELAGKDRGVTAEHKRLLYGDALRILRPLSLTGGRAAAGRGRTGGSACRRAVRGTCAPLRRVPTRSSGRRGTRRRSRRGASRGTGARAVRVRLLAAWRA